MRTTDKELQILQILWDKPGSSVRDVHEILYPNDETGYTTTLKLLQIMFDKKMVTRSKQGKTHFYLANVSRGDTQQQIVDKLLNTVFKGSASSLVMQLLGNSKSSKKELDEIRKLIDELDPEKDHGNHNLID